jgi:hypothetical protein
MRNLILSALILTSAFQTAMGEQDGEWLYSVENIHATITGYTGAGGAVTIPSRVNGFPVVRVGDGGPVFNYGNRSVTSVVIPEGVTSIGDNAFTDAYNLLTITIPNSVTYFGVHMKYNCPATIINDAVLTKMASNDAFVTAVANKILAASNNYGLATQIGLSNTIAATTSNFVTKSEITTLATKTELTNALAQSRTDGINSVLSNPNLWTLYTTNQIHAMAIGDLVLTSTNNGSFVLNYDIEQSEDLVNWYPYQGFAMPLTNLPANKAFVRIKAKQASSSYTGSSQTTPTTGLNNPISGGGNGVGDGTYPPPGGATDPSL